jgi:hypothetical protein
MPHETSYRFWADKGSWPTLAGYLFLGEVVDKIGRALWGEQWTGREVLTDGTSPEQAEAAKTEKRKRLEQAKLVSRMQAGDPSRRFVKRPAVASGRRDDPPFAYDPYSLERFELVQKCIAKGAEIGTLKTVARPVEGGQAIDLPREHWATERLAPRFAFCQINPKAPFELERRSSHYIFVAEEGLIEFVAIVSSAPQKARPIGRRGRPNKVHQTRKDLVTAYPPDGIPPAGVTLKEAARKLEAKKRPVPSDRTIGRAISANRDAVGTTGKRAAARGKNQA